MTYFILISGKNTSHFTIWESTTWSYEKIVLPFTATLRKEVKLYCSVFVFIMSKYFPYHVLLFPVGKYIQILW
ncbi:hypothetical protein [Lederbergia galactosidilytica]|uniref:hypothetical protein n=1 Tax=Lederbergia galactosidilytica TaxID=217031 RepID=UPI000B316AFA|nr:hypothetical protein [Lederbergia galactosidilytica]MBP1914051.1 hypothetical protein [Lederbergia galactosidilytica]